MADVVTLQLPQQRDFRGVAHLVLGGLATRLELTYDVLDDMQTALDELLERCEVEGDVTLALSVEGDSLVACVGPFGDRVAEELRSSGDALGLRRVLDTVVDRSEVTERDGGHWIELRKQMRTAPGG